MAKTLFKSPSVGTKYPVAAALVPLTYGAKTLFKSPDILISYPVTAALVPLTYGANIVIRSAPLTYIIFSCARHYIYIPKKLI
jgi:hypothetical protein